MIEVIAVLILLGVLGATAYSRMINTGAELFQTTETLKAHLRYAQTRAMNSDPYWGIRFHNEEKYYELECSGDECPEPPDPAPKLPSTDSSVHHYPESVSISGAPDVFYFNHLGAPIDESGDPMTETIELNLTEEGSSFDSSITVVKNTGFIQ